MQTSKEQPLPWMNSALSFLQKGMDVKIMPHGLSMLPFIMGDRDEIILSKITRELRRGDIVLFMRLNGQFVLHRVHHVAKEGLYFMGDSQSFLEGPVSYEKCLAIVEKYYKKGKLKDNSSLGMRVKYTLWFWLRPFRWWLIKANAWKNRVLRKNSNNK